MNIQAANVPDGSFSSLGSMVSLVFHMCWAAVGRPTFRRAYFSNTWWTAAIVFAGRASSLNTLSTVFGPTLLC